MMDRRNRDPLAIAIAGVGIILQIIIWVYWGGRLAEHVDGLDKRLAVNEVAATATGQAVALQGRDIAVLTVKLDDIKSGLDEANKKLDRDRK